MLNNPKNKDFYISNKKASLSDLSIKGVEIYTYDCGKGEISAMAFIGSSQKPSWMYYFISYADFLKRVIAYLP